MAISSVNFQKTKSNSKAETRRKFEAKYLLPKEHRQQNEFYDCGIEEEDLFKKELENANRKGGRIPQLRNSLWEGVLNLNENHTIEDVNRVAEHIAKKFNLYYMRGALHRDEGYIDKDTQEVKFNIHAHINFLTYKDAKQNWRLELVNRNALRELQTEVAELLNMQRGEKNSQSVRANHREFRANAESIKASRKALAKQKDLKAEITEIRNQLKESGATRKDYAELESINNKMKIEIKNKNLTIEAMKIQLRSIQTNYKNKIGQIFNEKIEEIKKLKDENVKLSEMLIEARKDVLILNGRVNSSLGLNRALKVDLNSKKQEISNLETKIAELEKDNSAISEIKEELSDKEKAKNIRNSLQTMTSETMLQFIVDYAKVRIESLSSSTGEVLIQNNSRLKI